MIAHHLVPSQLQKTTWNSQPYYLTTATKSPTKWPSLKKPPHQALTAKSCRFTRGSAVNAGIGPLVVKPLALLAAIAIVETAWDCSRCKRKPLRDPE